MRLIGGTLVFFLVLIETFSILPTRRGIVPRPANLHYRMGIIHVHSLFSHDGGGSVPKIAEAARGAGVDFVVLTDHNTARARREGLEKAYDGVDLFVEMEASLQPGHALVFFSHTAARELPDEEVERLALNHFNGNESRDGLFLAVAHPSNIKNPWSRLDKYSEGFELVNFDSVWQRELSESILDFGLTLLISPFNPFLAALRFFQVYPKDFIVWDNLNTMSRGHFGILAHDTHEKLKVNREYSLAWPTYEQTFRLASNAIFLKEPASLVFETRKKQIYAALREGRIALAYHSIFPFPGNDWRLQCGETVLRAGDEMPMKDGCEFVVDTPIELPYGKVVKVVRDGEVIHETRAAETSVRFPLKSPGVYRVETWVSPRTLTRAFLHRDVPYVFYNPLYVR